MPAVSSHYLIGIEMHLACVFVCTALLVEFSPPSHPNPSPSFTTTPTSTPSCCKRLSFPWLCGQTAVYIGRWHRAHFSQVQEANSFGSLHLIRTLFNSWDLSCYSDLILTVFFFFLQQPLYFKLFICQDQWPCMSRSEMCDGSMEHRERATGHEKAWTTLHMGVFL